jgi:hypothetical protein
MMAVVCYCTGACRVPPYQCPAFMQTPPSWFPATGPAIPYQFAVQMPIENGCICPPGANKECERPDCPRKDRTQIATSKG